MRPLPSRWDVPLLNTSAKQESVFIPALWAHEILRAYDRELTWQKWRRVWELRRSVQEL